MTHRGRRPKAFGVHALGAAMRDIPTPCGTPYESLGKPPFRSGRRTGSGRICGGVGKP